MFKLVDDGNMKGWSVISDDGKVIILVISSEKHAHWVVNALNRAIESELEAIDRGG